MHYVCDILMNSLSPPVSASRFLCSDLLSSPITKSPLPLTTGTESLENVCNLTSRMCTTVKIVMMILYLIKDITVLYSAD